MQTSLKTSNRKQHNQEPGYVAERMNPHFPGKKVVVYIAVEQGIDVGDCKYATVCDAHGTMVGSKSIPTARAAMKAPESFCDGCRCLTGEIADVEDEGHWSRPKSWWE